MARKDDADLVGARKRLVQLLGGAARVGEDDVDALADQALDDGVGALHFAADLGLWKRGGGRCGFSWRELGKKARHRNTAAGAEASPGIEVGEAGPPVHWRGRAQAAFHRGHRGPARARDRGGAGCRGCRREQGLDFVIANGENSAAGAGITGAIGPLAPRVGRGCDHPRRPRLGPARLGERDRADRPRVPAREPPGRVPRAGTTSSSSRGGSRSAVFTVLGRQFMNMKAEDPVRLRRPDDRAAAGPGGRDHRRDPRRGDLGEAGAGLAPRRPGDGRPRHPHPCADRGCVRAARRARPSCATSG